MISNCYQSVVGDVSYLITRDTEILVMVDSRHPNTSVTTTKVDQLTTVTTQAGVTTQKRRLGLGITHYRMAPTDYN